ncbi:MAG: hypothetical protein IS632_08970 [Thaumarchaeota archaeon]|nr:hypothetical protein [Nitrososphaerota archaeon]
MTKPYGDSPRCFSSRPGVAAAGGPARMPSRNAALPACGAGQMPRIRVWPVAGRDRGGRRRTAAVPGGRPE